MVNSKLTQDESGTFTTTNDFRKIGLMTDPNSDGAFTKYSGTTATQAKTFTYSGNTVAFSGDITLTQSTDGANGATACVVDVNASASTLRVVDVTNGANASAGYDGKYQDHFNAQLLMLQVVLVEFLQPYQHLLILVVLLS